MKKTILLIIVVILYIDSTAQNTAYITQSDIDLVNFAIRDKRVHIKLVAEIADYTLGEIKKRVDKEMFIKRIEDENGKDLSDTIKLSPGDREQILQQLAAFKTFKWSEEDAKKINLDRISVISRDSVGSRNLEHAIKYNIVPPVYFHNNNYCIFYFGYSCGWLCGQGRISVYKKTSSGWQLWSVLMDWYS